MTHEERFNNKQIWTLRVHEFQASGLTQQEWCSREGINCSTLRYWLRKLREESSQEQVPDWLQVCVSDGSSVPMLATAEKPKMQYDSAAAANICIHTNGIMIDVPLNTPIEYVSQLIRVVSRE